MTRDGGLRQEFRNRFHGYQWTSIETFTLPGVPDSEYCSPRGAQGWIEFKRTQGWKVKFEPFQPAWIDRRARYGGRVWVAVRRVPIAKKWAGYDQLWMVPGSLVLRLSHYGLDGIYGQLHAAGGFIAGGSGPASWDWARVGKILTQNPPEPFVSDGKDSINPGGARCTPAGGPKIRKPRTVEFNPL